MPQFSETELTAAVVRSFEDTPNPRAKFLLQELVKSLHDYVSKTDLTFEEWEYAIDFLTRTGQKCTHIRQEFILFPTCSASRCWSTPSTIANARARPRPPCSGRSMSASTR